MLGKFLKNLRQSKGLTQSEVAENFGSHRNSVVHVERTINPYQVERLSEYVSALGFDLELHFVDREDKRNTRVLKL